MQIVAAACKYDPHTAFSTDIVAKIWPPLLSHMQEDDGICLLDLDGHGARFKELSQQIIDNPVVYVDGDETLYRRRNNGGEENFTDASYRYVILVSHPLKYHHLARFVAEHFAGTPTVVLPFVDAGSSDAMQLEITVRETPPIVAVTYPGAGSKRFSPVFTALMNCYAVDQVSYVHPQFNKRHIRHKVLPTNPVYGFNFSTERRLPADVSESYFAGIVSTMDDQTWLEIHQPMRTAYLASLEDARAIYLYRDPRDILTTAYHRIVYDGGPSDLRSKDKEELFLQLLTGWDYVNDRDDFYGRVMGLEEMIETFCDIANYDQVYGLRYEDIRYQPRQAYRDLLDWLGLSQNALVQLSDGMLDQIAHFGSFEHQSNGKYREGLPDAKGIFRDGGPEIARGLRKGIKGDWKNHFTPAIVERVKAIAGRGLIELGYETDLDWQALAKGA